ncbi:SDR family oxidoreductase [Candidatus Spongiihabitans sp.]|uniref:SDR family oxidoreductase n=1 Tax=Candidatus Spongiihabitans sp. TaxID=3101308 RepID=UPI003C6FE184
MPYKGKIFLVTGASSGIGAAVSRLLLDNGAQVVAVSRRKITGESFSNREQQNFQSSRKGILKIMQCDLSDFESLDKSIGQTLKSISYLDGVVLCHGFGDFGSLEEFSVARIKRQIDTNLTSIMLISRLAMPIMKKQGCGDLVIIGSKSGLEGSKKGAVYCAAKFGLSGFVQALRKECAASGVRVAIVNPGMVDTEFFDELDFTPGQSRDNALQADDVANAVKTILDMPAGSVIDQINLSPQKSVVRNKSWKS